MYHQPSFLKYLLLAIEVLAFLSAFYNYQKFKKTNYKWFFYYLIYIVFIEIFNRKICFYLDRHLGFYVSYLSMPVEFLFLIWLFAWQSLRRKLLTICSATIYLLSFIPDLSIEKGSNYMNSFNYMIGSIILLFLIILELNKQIKSDDILNFRSNKMFYVTVGVALFYIGNLPFFGLYYLILKSPEVWNAYYMFFMITNCLMYLLFAASFIWGKPKP